MSFFSCDYNKRKYTNLSISNDLEMYHVHTVPRFVENQYLFIYVINFYMHNNLIKK